MPARSYLVYDVFTDTVLEGNPLAIVLDAGGLDTGAMQRIATEFNLSETVFVLPPDNDRHRARIRIFTPVHEMPFAGHPTVGSAVALAELDGIEDAGIFVLEENIGPFRCAVSRGERATFAEFDLARLPEPADFNVTKEAAAAALGLGAHEIGFENHAVTAWSAGVPYVTIPVAGLDAIGRASLDGKVWTQFIGANRDARSPAAYVYCRDTVRQGSAFHARMFAPHLGLVEDPATGSAAAAFAGAVMHFDQPTDGTHRVWVEQGMEMGRPSLIRLELQVAAGKLTLARIGGHAVKVAEGTLFA